MNTFHVFEEILDQRGVTGVALAPSPVLNRQQAELILAAEYVLLHGEKPVRDFAHVRCKNSEGVIVLYSKVEHYHRALPRLPAVCSIFAWDLRCSSSANDIGHERIRVRLEALLDCGENGYEENSYTWDGGVAEGEDGAEDGLQESTNAKERAETELIWEEELFTMALAVASLDPTSAWLRRGLRR